VKSALGHDVVAKEFFLAKGTTRDYTCLLKPIAWGSNFSNVAAGGEAGRAVAASNVENRE
jgi:hypothetical protein